jgi:putative membrane protein
MRWVRESINYMVPTASFGGDVLGGRLLVMWGQDMSTTTGSIVVDKTLEAASLFFFAFAAAFILLEDGGSYKIAHWAVLALTAMSAMLAAFLLAQRMGFLNLLDKVLMLLCRRCGGGPGKIDIQNAVWKMYSNSGRLSAATVLHFLAWMPGVLQVWLSLRFMGYGVSWPGAFIIEGLCQAACAAAFILPAKLGAQEAAYMTVGTFFGIPPSVGLALSLVQRLKDVFAGILGLLLWQGFEARGLWELWRERSSPEE